jgi:hypothetical protein
VQFNPLQKIVHDERLGDEIHRAKLKCQRPPFFKRVAGKKNDWRAMGNPTLFKLTADETKPNKIKVAREGDSNPRNGCVGFVKYACCSQNWPSARKSFSQISACILCKDYTKRSPDCWFTRRHDNEPDWVVGNSV